MRTSNRCGLIFCITISFFVSISAAGCTHPPSTLENHYVCLESGHKIGSVCHLKCRHGHSLVGPAKSITCLANRWTVTSGTSSTCKLVSCPAPPKITNGYYTCKSNNHTLNSTCKLNCNHGFKTSTTHSDIECLSTRRWSAPALCQEILCPAPPKVANGAYTCTSKTHKLNEVCHLKCSVGYKPSTTQTDIKCLSNDRWSAPALCREIKCPVPPKVTYGLYNCKSTTHKLNDVCHLQCIKGYKPSIVDSDIKCLSTEWSPLTSCVEIKCPSPPAVTHGSYRCSSSSVHKLNDVCHLQCASGYRPSTSHSDITCKATDTWSTSASCIEIKCPSPPTVTHGSYRCSSSSVHKLNDVCHLQCTSGYKPSTSHSDIKCRVSDKWSTPASCRDQLNTACHLHCDNGYKPSSSKSDVTCLSTDSWSQASSCVEIRCPVPPKVLNGQYSCSSSSLHKLNDVCHLQCTSGYKPRTQHSDITCGASDTWSTPASCVEIKCPLPPKVAHGQYSCVSSALHDVCHLQCESGYTPNKSHSDIKCLSSGKWSAIVSCEASPRDCEVCSGSLCDAPENDHIQPCPSSKPYCMNAMHSYRNGTTLVAKSCGSEADCNSKWWHGTSDRTECTDFDPARPQRRDISCFYCCTVSGCNKDTVPELKTLYVGHS